jgi:hypothetical protein
MGSPLPSDSGAARNPANLRAGKPGGYPRVLPVEFTQRPVRGTFLALHGFIRSNPLELPLVRLLALLTLMASAADHWTTYLCLKAPVAGWSVTEANPLADWLFTSIGLVPGLLLDSMITLCGVAFLLLTPAVPRMAKNVFFATISAWTSVAVVNNLLAVQALGLSLWSAS